MRNDPQFSATFRRIEFETRKPPTLMQKIIGGLVTVAVFGLALMFSVALFAVVLTVGAVAGAYFWWKTRALRKHMREEMARMRAEQAKRSPGEARADGMVIEGEIIREVPPAEER